MRHRDRRRHRRTERSGQRGCDNVISWNDERTARTGRRHYPPHGHAAIDRANQGEPTVRDRYPVRPISDGAPTHEGRRHPGRAGRQRADRGAHQDGIRDGWPAEDRAQVLSVAAFATHPSPADDAPLRPDQPDRALPDVEHDGPVRPHGPRVRSKVCPVLRDDQLREQRANAGQGRGPVFDHLAHGATPGPATAPNASATTSTIGHLPQQLQAQIGLQPPTPTRGSPNGEATAGEGAVHHPNPHCVEVAVHPPDVTPLVQRHIEVVGVLPGNPIRRLAVLGDHEVPAEIAEVRVKMGADRAPSSGTSQRW